MRKADLLARRSLVEGEAPASTIDPAWRVRKNPPYDCPLPTADCQQPAAR